ncbi:MAG: hypothetical protein JWQ63_1612 [Mucilaginibacter sp.]|jgi:hypothetical protein|nr:hypothetical protein [Mucilaginibacter sp.]
MENLDQKTRKQSFQYGLILGAILLVLGIFSFYFIIGMTSSFWMVIFAPFIFSIIIPIILVIFFSLDIRKKIGGYWSFKQATTGIFIMFFMAYVVQFIGRDLIFAKLIEPQMVQKTQEAVMNATTAMLEKTGADQAQIDDKKASIQKQFDLQTNITVGKVIQSIAITIILIFVLALIFGAIVKKDTPLFADTSYEDPAV